VSSRHLTELGFALIAVAAVACQLRAARAEGRGIPRAQRPVRVGEVVTAALTTRTGKVSVLLTWWWLGLHFIGR